MHTLQLGDGEVDTNLRCEGEEGIEAGSSDVRHRWMVMMMNDNDDDGDDGGGDEDEDDGRRQ